jgi:hypothetical protein
MYIYIHILILKVRLWDTRQPTAAATLQFAERVYAMDSKGDAIVVGTADRQIHVYNIANLGGTYICIYMYIYIYIHIHDPCT